MGDKPPHTRDAMPQDARQQELARALRENLKRRKAQAEARRLRDQVKQTDQPAPPKRP